MGMTIFDGFRGSRIGVPKRGPEEGSWGSKSGQKVVKKWSKRGQKVVLGGPEGGPGGNPEGGSPQALQRAFFFRRGSQTGFGWFFPLFDHFLTFFPLF